MTNPGNRLIAGGLKLALLAATALGKHVMGSPVSLRAFATNVTDQLYRISANSLSQTGSSGVAAATYGPPRMFGVGLRYEFGAR